MNKGGLVLVIAGALALFQVLGGNALERLGLVAAPAPGDDKAESPFAGVPDRGYNNVPHNGQGYPL